MTPHHHPLTHWLHTLTDQLHPHPVTVVERRRDHQDRSAARMRTIIAAIGIDSDADAEGGGYQVVDRAADLARHRGARLLITCVYHPLDPRALGADLDRVGPDDYQLRGTTPADTLARLAKDHARAHGAPDIHTHLLPEPGLHALLRLAATHDADTLVIGEPLLHTWTDRAASRVLDTPAIRLARHAPCDILIVRTR